jgi:hypothetical protein
MPPIEEEPELSESETEEEDDEATIPYADTSGSDDDDGLDGSFDPNFQHPASDASYLN